MDTEILANLAKAEGFEKSEQQRLPVFLGKFEQCIVEFVGKGRIVPGFVHLHGGFLPALAPQFRAKTMPTFQQRRLMKPAAQIVAVAKKGRFARKNHESTLCDFLGNRRIAELAASCAVNERRVPLYQRGKRLFGAAPGVFTEQFLIAAFVHSQIKLPPNHKIRKVFQTGAPFTTSWLAALSFRRSAMIS